MSDPATIAALDAQIAAGEALVASLRALRDRLVAKESDIFEAEGWDGETWLEAGEAAQRFSLPKDRIRRWCREGAGRRNGGRWMVAVERLRAKMEGS